MIEDLPVQLTDSTTVEIGAQSPLTTMIIATAFGMIVALLHLLAHRERPTYKLWRTLLLISPLIAMATEVLIAMVLLPSDGSAEVIIKEFNGRVVDMNRRFVLTARKASAT